MPTEAGNFAGQSNDREGEGANRALYIPKVIPFLCEKCLFTYRGYVVESWDTYAARMQTAEIALQSTTQTNAYTRGRARKIMAEYQKSTDTN